MSQKKAIRRIIAVKDQKGLVEFSNKLKVATIENFSRILDENSKIGITVMDYSAGTGDNNVVVEANIKPEEAQFLFEQAKAISCLGLRKGFEKTWTKIFGEYEDDKGKKDGSAIVTKLTISRKTHDQKGQPMLYPWAITIENGKGRKKKEDNTLAPRTYRCIKKAQKLLSDEDFISALRRVDTCIREFERRSADKIFDSGYKLLYEGKIDNHKKN